MNQTKATFAIEYFELIGTDGEIKGTAFSLLESDGDGFVFIPDVKCGSGLQVHTKHDLYNYLGLDWKEYPNRVIVDMSFQRLLELFLLIEVDRKVVESFVKTKWGEKGECDSLGYYCKPGNPGRVLLTKAYSLNLETCKIEDFSLIPDSRVEDYQLVFLTKYEVLDYCLSTYTQQPVPGELITLLETF